MSVTVSEGVPLRVFAMSHILSSCYYRVWTRDQFGCSEIRHGFFLLQRCIVSSKCFDVPALTVTTGATPTRLLLSSWNPSGCSCHWQCVGSGLQSESQLAWPGRIPRGNWAHRVSSCQVDSDNTCQVDSDKGPGPSSVRVPLIWKG